MHKVIYRFNQLMFLLYSKSLAKNIHLGKGIVINLWPSIVLHKNAQIILGDHVLLNSSNRSYHVNMFSRVKLMCDKPNSIIRIGNNTRIHGSCIHAHERIEIGKNCLIAANCQIIDANGHGTNLSQRIKSQGNTKPVIIGDNVWIGTGCIILPGTKIGNGAVLSAGSVIKGEIPENSVYGGNPAKFIKKIDL
jgi:acetyltransferase-like isoleucine patch superfamily enzyme